MRIAVLIFDGTASVDMTPYGVLSLARRIAPEIRVCTVAERVGIVTLSETLRVVADYDYTNAPQADALLVTGGPTWEKESNSPQTIEFIQRRARENTVASVCTGGMILAASGLLDGHSATTRAELIGKEPIAPLALMRERFPKVRPVEALVVDCGTIITGGGSLLCIDLTLYLIERFLGEKIAGEASRIIGYAVAHQANQNRLPVIREWDVRKRHEA
jgi:transcriptional regulator GlxA family with amidase domain